MAKARTAKLKVFRTPVGFDDAYVAAPSQKAALEAWGSATNLFSQGAAELVTDPKLTKEPLARPGEVIRKSRGTGDEHVRALGAVKKPKKKAGSRIRPGVTKKKGRRPSRVPVEKAEAAVELAKARHREAAGKLKAAEQALEAARKRYRSAMADWAD
jgi:hypothetical protein